MFVTGVLIVLVMAVPYFFGAYRRPLWLNLAYLSALVGLALTLAGLARGTRDAHPRPALLAACAARRGEHRQRRLP